jgi:hypothetical protein
MKKNSRLSTHMREKRTTRTQSEANEAVIALRVLAQQDALWAAPKLRELLVVLLDCGIVGPPELKRWTSHLREQGHPLLMRIFPEGLHQQISDRIDRVLEVMDMTGDA